MKDQYTTIPTEVLDLVKCLAKACADNHVRLDAYFVGDSAMTHQRIIKVAGKPYDARNVEAGINWILSKG